MRIIGGVWRGRALAAPEGDTTRPTAERVRQALFDMLMHAPWAGRDAVVGACVLDAFAGTGALGLEALSRGAAYAMFIERDRAALVALRANIASCRAETRAVVIAGDAGRIPTGPAFSLVFLDPPYGQGLIEHALMAIEQAGRLTAGALIVAELGRDQPAPAIVGEVLAERAHGAARLLILRKI